MIEIVSRSRSLVGESPVWDADGGALWWTDIRGRRLRRLDPASGDETEMETPELAGGVVLDEAGLPWAALETGLFRLDEATGAFRFVSAPDDLPRTHRFNDVTTDPAGRLIAGTMRDVAHGAAAKGTLYSFDGERWRTLFDGFWTINGLAFAPDGRTLYLADSHPSVRTVWACDYDPKTGEAGERRVFVDTAGLAGRPDGAAVDADGDYWLAGVGGGVLYRFTPDGRLRTEIALPVERPTKPAFGGVALDQLYVTSLSVNLERPSPEGLDGALLRLSPGVRGAPVPRFSFKREAPNSVTN